MRKKESDWDELLRREREWQNRVGGQLQERIASLPGTQLVLDHQFNRIADALASRVEGRVLDIGCGTGTLLKWMKERQQVEAFGLDLAQQSLLLGKRDGLTKGLCGCAEALPVKDSSFSCIVCKGSVHHFTDAVQALEEMYRVLMPGGKVVFFEPMGSFVTNWVRKVVPGTGKYESPVDLSHKEEFTAWMLQQHLKGAGFVDIEASFHDVLAYPFTGGYAEGMFSRSIRMMRIMLKCEMWLERIKLLANVRKLLAWRMLVRASKPPLP